MTRKTVAELEARLSTGDSSDDSIAAGMIQDLVDSYLDLDTHEANLAGTGSVLLNVSKVLFTLSGADMNVTTDQAFTKVGTFGNYIIQTIRAYSPSTDLTAADGGIYQAASKAGNAIVASTQVYTTLTAATEGMDLTLTAFGRDVLTATPILSLTGAQGGAATCSFYVIGIPLTAS